MIIKPVPAYFNHATKQIFCNDNIIAAISVWKLQNNLAFQAVIL